MLCDLLQVASCRLQMDFATCNLQPIDMSSAFTLLHSTRLGRRGRIETAHGVIETTFFMPVGTAGAMKGLTHEDLLALGAQILLCNTYHLHLHPGEDVVFKAGGLHAFIHWKKPILTDSGGYQVFSLARLRSIDDTGVTFRSHIDGSKHRLDPVSAMQIRSETHSDRFGRLSGLLPCATSIHRRHGRYLSLAYRWQQAPVGSRFRDANPTQIGR